MRKTMLWAFLALALFFIHAPAIWAEEPMPASSSQTFQVEPPEGLPVQYARILGWRPAYETLNDAVANRPLRSVGGWDVWVTVLEGADVDGQRYYRTGKGWMSARHLFLSEGSELQGVDLQEYEGERAVMVHWPKVGVRAEPSASAPLVGSHIGYDVLTIREERNVGGEVWYRISNKGWLHSQYVRHLAGSARPAEVSAEDKWIEIDLSEQVLVAHEGDTPVFATLTATGKAPTTTIEGLFWITKKYETDHMAGGWFTDDPYDLADVPWTMYFYSNYALHSAYWHDEFGEVRSHGCVNLSPADAKWIFDWSGPTMPEGASYVEVTDDNLGTWVWVHP